MSDEQVGTENGGEKQTRQEVNTKGERSGLKHMDNQNVESPWLPLEANKCPNS